MSHNPHIPTSPNVGNPAPTEHGFSPLGADKTQQLPDVTQRVDRIAQPNSIPTLIRGDVQAILGYAAAIGATNQAVSKSNNGYLISSEELVSTIAQFVQKPDEPFKSKKLAGLHNTASLGRFDRIRQKFTKGESLASDDDDEMLPGYKAVSRTHGLRAELMRLHDAGELEDVELGELPAFNAESQEWQLSPAQFRGFIIGLGEKSVVDGIAQPHITELLRTVSLWVNRQLDALPKEPFEWEWLNARNVISTHVFERLGSRTFPPSLRAAAYNAVMAQVEPNARTVNLRISEPQREDPITQETVRNRSTISMGSAALDLVLNDDSRTLAQMPDADLHQLQANLRLWMEEDAHPVVRRLMGESAADIARARDFEREGNVDAAAVLYGQAAENLNRSLREHPDDATRFQRYKDMVQKIDFELRQRT